MSSVKNCLDLTMLKKAQRILIFNVNWLGDVLFSTAVIRNLRYNFPSAYICCAVPSRCYLVLKGNPYLDEVIIFDERQHHKRFRDKLSFIKQLKKRHFDVVFLLHRSMTRALICWLAAIPRRIGYTTKKRWFLLTQRLKPPALDSLHRIDYYLNILSGVGLRVEDRFLDFFVSDEDERFVDEFLSQKVKSKAGPWIGLNPGGNWALKRWSKEYWARLADNLIIELKAEVFFTGGPEDIYLVKEITQAMLNRPLVVTGIFNLKQFGALCKRLSLFVSADSGPLHIANAVGTKNILALFGPTDPAITGPYPTKNVLILQNTSGCKIPCYQLGCLDNRCMKAITPQWVMDKIRGLING